VVLRSDKPCMISMKLSLLLPFEAEPNSGAFFYSVVSEASIVGLSPSVITDLINSLANLSTVFLCMWSSFSPSELLEESLFSVYSLLDP
jgi:hypothetical protein